MRILKRGLGLLLVVVLVAVVAAAGFLTWVTVRAMPETTGTIAATGLGAPVTVARDAAGIAHITADTPHDLFFAQGYVHASERMWQMEVWRHISAGRLAEVFGASRLDTDKFIRTLGWRVAAQRDLDAVAPPARAVLDAYTQGVNAWLDTHRGSLGLAFLVAGVTPEPWTNLETIRGARSRHGTWAATSTPRCSGTWPTGSWATRPGRMSSSPPTATALRSSPRPACPGRAARQPAREATRGLGFDGDDGGPRRHDGRPQPRNRGLPRPR